MRSYALRTALTAAPAAVCGIAIAALAALTGPYAGFASRCEAFEQRLAANRVELTRTIVFDIDDESVRRLQGGLGEWPYANDVYALVANWLWRSGARALVFDIAFLDERPGERAFAAALNPRAVLAAFPRSSVRANPPDDRGRLQSLGLQIANLPASRAAAIDPALPRPALTGTGGARVGAAAPEGDPAAFAERLALLYRVEDKVLPGLSLAALLAADGWPHLSVEAGELVAASRRWPIEEAGEALLRYPSNARELPMVPFYRLALAAAGVPEQNSLADEVRGRIVFVGRSGAAPSGRIRASDGDLTGLQHAALATELLAQGQVSRPASRPTDALLIALAACAALVVALRGARARPGEHVAAAACAVVLPGAAGIALFVMGTSSHWPFAMLAGLTVELAGATLWQVERRRARAGPRVASRGDGREAGVSLEFLERLVAALRTPLSGIGAYNRVSQGSEDLSRDERVRIAGIIARNCEHVVALLDRHLDLARIAAGSLAIERKSENSVGQVRQSLETVRAAAERKGLALSIEIARPPPDALMLDAARLRQVLVILLANSIEVCVRGAIVVGVDWDGDALLLDLRDSARDLDAGKLRAIGASLRGAGDLAAEAGSGAALALAGRLVRAMQGTISVGSIVGEGSRVTLRLPAHAAEGKTPGAVAGGAGAVIAVAESGEIAVKIDPVARKLVPQFLAMCRADVAAMRKDFDAGDFDALRRTGHKLKGAGGSYGFNEITHIGAAIETTAASGASDELQRLIDAFESYLDRVRPVYD